MSDRYEDLHEQIDRQRRDAAPMGGSWKKEAGSWETIREFRDYARGRQRKTLNQDQIRIMSALLKHDFSDNVLKLILETHANRLRVARFDVDDENVADFLYDLWVKNQFPDLFSDALYATLRDGNHAIGLAWKAADRPGTFYGGRVVLTRERWWNGEDGVFVMYGDDGQPVYAVKEWKTSDRKPLTRRTVYFPESINRFVRDGEKWTPYTLPGEDAFEAVDPESGQRLRGVVPWVKRDGSPLGIPLIHLSNGTDNDSFYGTSLLDGGPLAFQDQLNGIQHDITAAALMNGSPQTWSKGFELPEDETTGDKIRIKTGPGMHHHAPEATAEFHVLEPGDLTQLGKSYHIKLEALCRNTNTPVHLITGQWPSGEAIFRAEMPLVGSTKKLGESVGPQTSSIAHRATEIENAFGYVVLDEEALIQTVFEPAEQRDSLTMWSVGEKAAAFVSTREVLRLAGYPPSRIDEIMTERRDEQAEKISAAQAAFSRPADLDLLMQASGQSVDVASENDDSNDES
jgi:hypothetical protein